MKIFKGIDELRESLSEAKDEEKSIGLVPTMGYLHEGHASLIRRARKENDVVVVSIFVNPTQFGENEDLDTYPRDLEADSKLCKEIGVDFIFAPEASEMYKNPKTFVDIEGLSDNLCGAKRPGHFRGVCTVCTKLFNITNADRAYFGQKDAQQVAIISKMVEDLNIPIEIISCPIVREEDGLALSSRNTYLSNEERKAALSLSKAIFKAEDLANNGASVSDVIGKIKDIISSENLAKIDYVSVVDLHTMEDASDFDGDRLVAIAAFIGKTRLIDNFIFRKQI